MANRVIDGRFELVARLGGGGMGLVWRAWDQALHREVALKEVRPPDPALGEHDPAQARELRARVLREARALARLNHPHVVTIHHIVDTGEDAFPWLVMELVTGGTLQDRLSDGPLSPAEAARLGREVLSALRAAHAVGILHRDVKPGNVLLRPDGRWVLTDFGIAAVQESPGLTATGSFIGSPEYMAPERINGHEGDPASDLWSLGMLLYVAVEGRHPLRRATPLATLAAVLNQEAPPPERAGALAPVLFALLNRDPAARPDPGTLDRMLTAAAQDPGPPPYSGPHPLHGPSHAGPSHPGPSHAGSSHAGPPLHGPFSSGPHGLPGQGPPSGSAGSYPGSHGGPAYAGSPAYGPGGGQPSGPQGASWSTLPPHGRRSGRRRGVTTSIVLGVAAVVVAAAVVWALPGFQRGGVTAAPSAGDRTSAPPASGRPPETTPEKTREAATEETQGPPEEPADLLTPAGMRRLVADLRTVMGGTEVVELVVYPTYAIAGAPVKGRKAVYDRYTYRGGVATKDGPGGPVTNPTVNLRAYNWNALPGLIRRADKELGIKKPTTRYVIVDAAFYENGSIRVYVSDEYHATGYLAADPTGKVLAKYPAGG
ncbi:protein kinase [Nonomuraea sp. MCN248]|uniref:non-specific serine/threonine protein kinase n=1 Tax=Nonomuraea corallina TaxID=2989783 RepID=A0ABT4S8I5_9ACTN|nr:serine/threonine-protein kinase [Nonomuraea corallina]MDA0633526.1 protein kinase [Nonomuraea corallina]